jgi:GntR family transcriptional regulator
MTADSSPLPLNLERNSAVPMYVQLAALIEAHIRSGRLKPGEGLESESKLCKRLSISRVTARLAIDELAKKALVERRQGKGTYVAHPQLRHDPSDVNNFFDTLFARGINPASRLIAFGLARPPREMTLAFGIAEQAALMQFGRLYRLDRRAVGMSQSWLIAEAAAFSRSQAEAQSTAKLFEQVLGLKLGRSEVHVRACPAARNVAEHLDIRERSPVLALVRNRYLADGRIAEITTFTMNPKSYELVFSDSGATGHGFTLKNLAA